MKSVYLLISLIISFTVQSSEVIDTKLTNLTNDRVFPDYTFVQVSNKPVRDSNHCHSNGTFDFVLKTDDPFGKHMHAQLLAAFAAGKQVRIVGFDTCPAANVEEIRRIEIY